MKTLIAIPCMDYLQTSFAKSLLALMKIGDCQVSFLCSSLIYDARNALAMQAVSEGYDRVLWLDSDMVFQPDLLIKLSRHLDEGKEFVSALSFKRKPPFTPVIYSNVQYDKDEETDKVIVKAASFTDYPKDEVFRIAGCGFGGVLMTTDLINRVGEKFGFPFSPAIGLGEDLSFCVRARQLGAELWCDSRIKMGHVGLGTITEETFQSMR